MGRNITDEDIIKHKKNAIKQLNNAFETFINSPNSKHKKKADLIAYWIEDYSKYLLSEEKFDYTFIPRYKRGDIISVNFGFNVGSEHGGLHYAMVLDNDNRRSSPVITVIPLSSGKEEGTYERDVFLGNELHDKLNAKYNKLITQVENELSEVTKMMDVLEKSANSNLDAEENLQKDVTELLNNLSNRVLKLESERKTLKIYEKEISKLKEGSIALMEQITTVSKMRIYKPKNSSDLLYGIKFSDGAMDKINERLKELYIYSK
jgi:hypothetical protein